MSEIIKKQIELFNKYGIQNYTIVGGMITINYSLYLNSLTAIPDSYFLKNTKINGSLFLSSLNQTDEKNVENNIIRNIQTGYNKENLYCYFDGILSKVIRVSEKMGFTIYESPFEYIVTKDGYSAHAKTVKDGIKDLEFKILSEKIKKDPIYEYTIITVNYYRIITGACDLGCRAWLDRNNIEYDIIDGKTVEKTPIKAKELLPILESSNAYGIEKFKALINF